MSGENKQVFVRLFKEEAQPGLSSRTQRGLCLLCPEPGGPSLGHPEPSSSPDIGAEHSRWISTWRAGISHQKGLKQSFHP